MLHSLLKPYDILKLLWIIQTTSIACSHMKIEMYMCYHYKF